jgi:hypothetical protein
MLKNFAKFSVTKQGLGHVALPCRDASQALFSPFSLNFTMQKEDSPSHQNVGKYMEY